jgi:hypothetical protein
MTTLDFDDVPDSRRIRPPTVDERVRDLEVAYDARAREMIDAAERVKKLDDRIAGVESWPQRLVIAVVTGAVAMVGTVAGFGWSLSAQLARMEERLDAGVTEDTRRDTRIDRLEDRAWQRFDATTHATTDE